MDPSPREDAYLLSVQKGSARERHHDSNDISSSSAPEEKKNIWGICFVGSSVVCIYSFFLFAFSLLLYAKLKDIDSRITYGLVFSPLWLLMYAFLFLYLIAWFLPSNNNYALANKFDAVFTTYNIIGLTIFTGLLAANLDGLINISYALVVLPLVVQFSGSILLGWKFASEEKKQLIIWVHIFILACTLLMGLKIGAHSLGLFYTEYHWTWTFTPFYFIAALVAIFLIVKVFHDGCSDEFRVSKRKGIITCFFWMNLFNCVFLPVSSTLILNVYLELGKGTPANAIIPLIILFGLMAATNVLSAILSLLSAMVNGCDLPQFTLEALLPTYIMEALFEKKVETKENNEDGDSSPEGETADSSGQEEAVNGATSNPDDVNPPSRESSAV